MSALGRPAPPTRVLREFGVGGPAVRLRGGQGTSWRAGALVLKPVADEEEAGWLGPVLESIPQDGFRLATPVTTSAGRWVVDGWAAARWVTGVADPRAHWHELLAASRAFHQAVSRVPRPAFLDKRSHWWARADRSSWGEAPPPAAPALRHLRANLTGMLEPVDDEPQLVHEDLSGNVLFHPHLAPAVIDVSPYWRPERLAEAIVVADALLGWGEGSSVARNAGCAGAPSWVARGLLFRLDTLGFELAETGREPAHAELASFDRALAHLRGFT